MLKNGKTLNCHICSKEFYVPGYRIKSAKFCSIACQNIKRWEKHTYLCKNCNKLCITSPCRKKIRKVFCSMQCRTNFSNDAKERRKKQKIYQRLRRGSKSTRTLRGDIFSLREKKCQVCGYNEYDFCLDLHHIDGNPKNNVSENIAILCAMCHRKLHKKIINLEGIYATT